MSFCEHCAGQRFDRAQVLRTLREARKRLRSEGSECSSDEAIALVILSLIHISEPTRPY